MSSNSQSGIQDPPDVDPEDRLNEFGRQGRRSFAPWAFLSRLVGPPGIVILGQLVLQAAAWGFYGTLRRRGFISVPSFALLQAVRYKPVAWACTVASTALSLLSSYLFSWGVIQVVTFRMRKEGMTFATFVWSVKTASSSFSRGNRKQCKWTILSLIVIVMHSAQISGWNTLLTPELTSHDTPILARELDLSTPLLKPSGALDFCMFNSSNLLALSVGQTGSGSAALNDVEGFPTSVTFMENAFNTSTAGILPLAFTSVDATPWFGNENDNVTTLLPKALSAPSIGFRNGLSWTSTMYQQGFTADVSCKFENLTRDTTPSLIIDTIDGTESSPSYVSMSSNCAAPEGSDLSSLLNYTSTETFIGEGHGYILMIACGGSATNYSLIFHGSGLYDFMKTMVCTLTPRIPSVIVGYTYNFGYASTTIDTMALLGGKPDIGGPAAISAVTTIYNMLEFSQALATNTMGDQLSSAFTTTNDELGVLPATELYLRGVSEYAGTVFRACLSVTNGTFVNGVPKNMTIASGGRLHTQFFGWAPSAPTGAALGPGLLIAFATICLVLRAVWDHVADPEPREPFDPSDPMHLVSAAAAGGVDGVFTGTTEKELNAAADVRIFVGEFHEQKPALITQRHPAVILSPPPPPVQV